MDLDFLDCRCRQLFMAEIHIHVSLAVAFRHEDADSDALPVIDLVAGIGYAWLRSVNQ